MSDLLTADSAPPVRPRPERPCSHDQFAKELLGLPADWRVVSWKVIEVDKVRVGVQVEGGVYRQTISRGPRKGKLDYRKPEPGSSVTLTIGEKQFHAWRAQWEAETGLCSECSGTGVVFAGWNNITGTRMRPCRPCGGTGNRPVVASEAA